MATHNQPVVFMIRSISDKFLVSIDVVRSLKNKIFIYSAIKIMANIELPYSILTSSDSPSVNSNGVRCASAKNRDKSSDC